MGDDVPPVSPPAHPLPALRVIRRRPGALHPVGPIVFRPGGEGRGQGGEGRPAGAQTPGAGHLADQVDRRLLPGAPPPRAPARTYFAGAK